MPRDQLASGQVLPRVDVDTVMARDAKQTLRAARDRAHTLLRRVNQLDAGCQAQVGARHSVNIARVLGIHQSPSKAAVTRGRFVCRQIWRRGRYRCDLNRCRLSGIGYGSRGGRDRCMINYWK